MTQFDKSSVTDADIRSLRDEAAAHGDDEQVALCDAAAEGNGDARERCVDAIAATAAAAEVES